MLGKLMKYELRATSRTMLPLLLLTLLLSVFTRMTSAVVQSGHSKFITVINTLLILAFFLALIGTALVVTALNTGAMYIDSVIYNYYSYAYVFGGLVVRIISGAATAVLMVFVAPPVVNLLNRSLDTVRTAQ